MHWSRSWRGLSLLLVRQPILVRHITWDFNMSHTALPSSRFPSKIQPHTWLAPSWHHRSTHLIPMCQTIRCCPTHTLSQILCSKTHLDGSRVWILERGLWLWSRRAARSLRVKAAAPSNKAYPSESAVSLDPIVHSLTSLAAICSVSLFFIQFIRLVEIVRNRRSFCVVDMIPKSVCIGFIQCAMFGNEAVWSGILWWYCVVFSHVNLTPMYSLFGTYMYSCAAKLVKSMYTLIDEMLSLRGISSIH